MNCSPLPMGEGTDELQVNVARGRVVVLAVAGLRGKE